MAPVTDQSAAATNGLALARAVGDGVFQADPNGIRRFAAVLSQQAHELRMLLSSEFIRIGQALTRETQEFTTDHQPSPLYAGTAAALTANTEVYSRNITTLATRMEQDSAALTWLADKIANDQQSLASEMRSIGDEPHPVATTVASTVGSVDRGGAPAAGWTASDMEIAKGLAADTANVNGYRDILTGNGEPSAMSPGVKAALASLLGLPPPR